MSGKKTVQPPRRSFSGSLLASFLIIFAGGSICTMIVAMASPAENTGGVWAVMLVFALIALIPLRCLQQSKDKGLVAPKRRESFWTMLRELFEEPERRTPEIKTWKRKRTDHVPQPHGQEYLTFVRERSGD